MDPRNSDLHGPETHDDRPTTKRTTTTSRTREGATTALLWPPAVETDSYPEDMAARDQWIVWKPTETGGKVPRAPWNNPGSPDRYIDHTDPDPWVSYSEAVEWVAANPEYGLGFVLKERDPFTLIDFDKARDTDTGGVHPTVRDVLLRAGSYADVSVSGTGIHVMVRGSLPDGLRSITKSPLQEDSDFPEASIEVYSAGQFVAMAGARLAGTPVECRDGQPLLEDLMEEYGAPAEESKGSKSPLPTPEIGTDLEERLRGAMFCDAKLTPLWEGRYADAGFPRDRSKAECSLAERLGWWFYRDRRLVRRLMEQAMSEHPRTSRGEARKWAECGESYRESVLQYAERGNYYDGELSRMRSLVSDRVMNALLQGLLDLQEASTEDLVDYLREEHDLERSDRQIRRAMGLYEESNLINYKRSGRSGVWVIGE